MCNSNELNTDFLQISDVFRASWTGPSQPKAITHVKAYRFKNRLK